MNEIDISMRAWKIHNLWASYAHRIDDGDSASWGELFDEDAVLRLPTHTYVGRSEIVDYASRRDAASGRHFVSNIETAIEPLAQGTAHVVADFLFVPAVGTASSTAPRGRYRSTLVWRQRDWKIANHAVEFA